jgi:Response regulators consisting of a CheY-like receiver domain and a winged-helix DNA-binding domain
MDGKMDRILLVEDEEDFLEALAHELTANGYEVESVSNGSAVLASLACGGFAAVILDFGLPALDGIEVLRRIRKESAIPVMALTGRGSLEDRVLGFEIGVDDYVVKPCSMRELVLRLRALLRRAHHAADLSLSDRKGVLVGGGTLRAGALELELDSRLVRSAGQDVELTKIEFDLLVLLMRNPRRAFNRSYLLDVVWGDEKDSSERSVDNAIMRLRKKLGESGNSIETLWGIGYRFMKDVEAIAR